MRYDQAIETLDPIGPSLWQFRDDGRNPAAGHVYEVLGMGELNEEAVVIRGRSPLASMAGGRWRRLYFVEQWERETGFPRFWVVEPIEEFLERFEEVDRTLIPRSESVLGEVGRVLTMLG